MFSRKIKVELIFCALFLTCTIVSKAQNDTTNVRLLCNKAIEEINKGNYAQASISAKDALTVAKETKNSEFIILAYNTLGTCSINNNNFKSALLFYQEALKIAENEGNDKSLSTCLLNIGNTYYYQESFSEAIEKFMASIPFSQKSKNYPNIIEAQNLIAICHYYKGDYEKSLVTYQLALKEIKQYNLPKFYAQIYLGIGNLFLAQKNYKNALEEYETSKKYAQQNNQIDLESQALNNLGHTYRLLQDYDNALKISEQGLKLKEENNLEPDDIINSLINIGNIYLEKGDNENAIKYYTNALSKARQIKNKAGIAMTLINIGLTYNRLKNTGQAIMALEEAISFCQQSNRNDLLLNGYEELADAYSNANNFKKAFEYQRLYTQLKDKILSETNSRNLNELQVQYDSEKKETQIALLNNTKKSQLTIIYLAAIGLLITIIFLFLLFRNLKNIRKAKQIIESQKQEVEQQKEIADSRRIIAEEQTEIIASQKKIVDEKQKEILDSIHYASRIQQAMLTSKSLIKKELGYVGADYFILYKPKDIVAGDFYWAYSSGLANLHKTNFEQHEISKSKKGKFYICTADCTGHGIPGAFMSLLNISFLNKNVIGRKSRTPDDILNEQRREIIKALNPTGNENTKDGMDCTLCVFDFNQMQLDFASANSSLYYIHNNEFNEFKGNKMPIGKHERDQEPFTLQTLKLTKGDVIYTTTDGYADQFSNDNKKLKSKALKEMLFKIHKLEMKEQRDYLAEFIENWKGGAEQTDDILIIGIKI